jgi:hypothetical protein
MDALILDLCMALSTTLERLKLVSLKPVIKRNLLLRKLLTLRELEKLEILLPYTLQELLIKKCLELLRLTLDYYLLLLDNLTL